MKHSMRITLILLTFFFISQVLGLAIISKYLDVSKTLETGEIKHKLLPYDLQPPEVEKDYSFVYVFIAILIGTILMFLLIKYMQLLLWKIWYFTAISFSLLLGFGAFVSQRNALIGALIFAWLKVFKPSVILHNFTELFIYGGLAAFFVSIFNVKSAIILLVLISLYDMYAVWKSKHMIMLAKFQSESQMFAGLFIPYKMGKLVKFKSGTGAFKKIKTAMLGGGDIAFPLFFAGAVLENAILTMSLQQALWKVLVIPIGATIALSLLFWKSKESKFYPAMPVLSIGCFVGYAVFLLI
ncbi:hypothetical protein J4418_01050 [Candidatus Woesearchaeota archaeon]|nr:hypothetical protein [Candidatus Woesearchaeota archaeon]